MEEDMRTPVTENTQDSEQRSAQRQSGADREPNLGEESSADAVADELSESGELERAAEHEKEMTRLGAEVKGEGQIP